MNRARIITNLDELKDDEVEYNKFRKVEDKKSNIKNGKRNRELEDLLNDLNQDSDTEKPHKGHSRNMALNKFSSHGMTDIPGGGS